MPRKRKTASVVTGIGMTAKQMKRKKPINSDFLNDIQPLTENQKKFFDDYNSGKHLFAYGCAGTCLLYTSPSPRDRG